MRRGTPSTSGSRQNGILTFKVAGRGAKARHTDGFLTTTSHIAMSAQPTPMISLPDASYDVLKRHIVGQNKLLRMKRRGEIDTLVHAPTWLEQRTEVSTPHFDCDIHVPRGEGLDTSVYSRSLVEMARCVQDAMRDCFNAEGTPYEGLPPGVTEGDEPPLFRCMVATAKHKTMPLPVLEGVAAEEAAVATAAAGGTPGVVARDQEWKAHLYFPNLAMTSYQIRVAREVAIARLKHHFRESPLKGVDWACALDDRVYRTNGLRMLYCDKATPCECKAATGRASPSCTKCEGGGRVYAHRIYTVTFLLKGNGAIDKGETAQKVTRVANRSFGSSTATNNDITLAQYKALDLACIRLPHTCITPGFRIPRGTSAVMPYTYVKRAEGSDARWAKRGALPYVPLKRPTLVHITDERDWRNLFLLRTIRGYAASGNTSKPFYPYRALERAEVYVQAEGRYLRVDVLGGGDNYCCNQRRQHKCCRVFFLVRRGKSGSPVGVTQHCNCPKPGVSGSYALTCKAYSKRRYDTQSESVMAKDWARVLPVLPNGHTEQQLFAPPGTPAAAPLPDDIEALSDDEAEAILAADTRRRHLSGGGAGAGAGVGASMPPLPGAAKRRRTVTFASGVVGGADKTKRHRTGPGSVLSAGSSGTVSTTSTASRRRRGVGDCFNADRSHTHSSDARTIASAEESAAIAAAHGLQLGGALDNVTSLADLTDAIMAASESVARIHKTSDGGSRQGLEVVDEGDDAF